MLSSHLKRLAKLTVTQAARCLHTTGVVQSGAGPHNALLTHLEGTCICLPIYLCIYCHTLQTCRTGLLKVVKRQWGSRRDTMYLWVSWIFTKIFVYAFTYKLI